ncbi:MAG: hypothetical protein WCS88_04005 [Patescibacteria group bacterium]|jgi:hypothetical protein
MGDPLSEAIAHCIESECQECRDGHLQLAAWMRELVELRRLGDKPGRIVAAVRALVVEGGASVVLSTSEPLSMQEMDECAEFLSAEGERIGVKFTLLAWPLEVASDWRRRPPTHAEIVAHHKATAVAGVSLWQYWKDDEHSPEVQEVDDIDDEVEFVSWPEYRWRAVTAGADPWPWPEVAP